MAETLDAWERIKLYAYQHAHPDDTERIRADVEEIEGLLDGRPVTAGTARTPVDPALLCSTECHEEVTRREWSEPCNATPVAIRLDPNEGTPYPVCARHARADMVPLTAWVDGVVLSREEAELAAPALRNAAARHATASGAAWHALAADLRALAARLEAAS